MSFFKVALSEKRDTYSAATEPPLFLGGPDGGCVLDEAADALAEGGGGLGDAPPDLDVGSGGLGEDPPGLVEGGGGRGLVDLPLGVGDALLLSPSGGRGMKVFRSC